MSILSTDIAIIGSGPAGFTAALYASRASLNVILFEGLQPGGQLTITTEIENYPGFEHGIMGPELMDVMRKQAHRFGTESRFESINRVDFTSGQFKLWNERGDEYHARAVIVATGATAKLLNAPGEAEYMGYGVSACATCDGFFFRDQHVFVIGGGDTAMEEASYLTKYASKVTVVHRRKEFRASRIMIDRAMRNDKIEFLLDSVVEEYVGITEGKRKQLTHLKVRNTDTNEVTLIPTTGAFVAIGHQPNTQLFNGLLDMDEVGYILTQGKSANTNIPGVFACGDAQDSVYRQAITAAGSGCMAAIDAERWLAHQRQH